VPTPEAAPGRCRLGAVVVVVDGLRHPIGQVCGGGGPPMHPLRDEEESPRRDDDHNDQPTATHGGKRYGS
jgi:hypothetical protein